MGAGDAIGGLSSSTVGASGGRRLSLMLRVSVVSVSAIGNAAAVLDALGGETLAVTLLSLAGGRYSHSSTV